VGPIETLWGALVLVFIVIALVRGYHRELGVTVLMLIVLFLELQFGGKLETFLLKQVFPKIQTLLAIHFSEETRNFLLVLIYQGVLIAVVFATYAGRTFSFPGTPPGGLEGFFFNVIVGMVNGYLFTGTLWYYLDKYHYPYIAKYGLFKPDLLTDRARSMLHLLPPVLFGDHPEFLAAFAGILVILSVRK